MRLENTINIGWTVLEAGPFHFRAWIACGLTQRTSTGGAHANPRSLLLALPLSSDAGFLLQSYMPCDAFAKSCQSSLGGGTGWICSGWDIGFVQKVLNGKTYSSKLKIDHTMLERMQLLPNTFVRGMTRYQPCARC